MKKHLTEMMGFRGWWGGSLLQFSHPMLSGRPHQGQDGQAQHQLRGAVCSRDLGVGRDASGLPRELIYVYARSDF